MNRVLKPLQERFQLLHPLLQRDNSPLLINRVGGQRDSFPLIISRVGVRSRIGLRVAAPLDHPV